MATVTERLDSLESILGQFIVHTDVALRRLENEMRVFKDEMRAFKDEMRVFKDEMGAFKDEMRVFKDEMGAFKDEMRVFKDEMGAFKDDSVKAREKMYKQWGDIANKMGTIVEDMVIPNIGEIAKNYFGCSDFEFFASRAKKKHFKDRSRTREFDVIAVCDDKVLVNETKSTPRINYIDDFKDILKEFYDFFPEYSQKKIIPIFASLYLSEDVVKYLTKNGIYALAIKGDTMDLLNYNDILGAI